MLTPMYPRFSFMTTINKLLKHLQAFSNLICLPSCVEAVSTAFLVDGRFPKPPLHVPSPPPHNNKHTVLTLTVRHRGGLGGTAFSARHVCALSQKWRQRSGIPPPPNTHHQSLTQRCTLRFRLGHCLNTTSPYYVLECCIIHNERQFAYSLQSS